MAQKRSHPAAEPPPGTTVGRERYTGKMIPAGVLGGDRLADWPRALSETNRLKLILLQSRNAVLSIGRGRSAVIAPAAVFLPHAADIGLSLPAAGPEDKLILFHPQFVFDTLGADFDFSQARDPGSNYDWFLLRRFAPDRPAAERVLLLEPRVCRYLDDAAGRMKTELESQPDWSWPCRARSFILEILIACLRLQSTGAGPSAGDGALVSEPGLEGLFGFIVSNLREKLSVEKIAAEFRTNRTTLQEKMRRATGLSVAQYLIRLRVQTASVLLRNTSLSVAEIMERTGFADESHFSRSFKKFTRRSPSEFRKEFVVPEYVK